jgi:hypothetical protein
MEERKLEIYESGAIWAEINKKRILGIFRTGDRVRKKLSDEAGEWQGHVVGAYLTTSGIGYAVRSEREKKAVQIYPEKALEYVP